MEKFYGKRGLSKDFMNLVLIFFIVVVVALLIFFVKKFIFLEEDSQNVSESEIANKTIPKNSSEKVVYLDKEVELHLDKGYVTGFRGPDESHSLPGYTDDNIMNFILSIKEYDTSEKIVDYINSEFKVIKRNDGIIRSAISTFNSKEGTKADLLRLSLELLSLNKNFAVFIVYEYESGFGSVVVFRENIASKYLYFENEELKVDNPGNSFKETLGKEEEREKIIINKFGIFPELKIRSEEELEEGGIEEWYNK